eukprot:gene4484-71_t
MNPSQAAGDGSSTNKACVEDQSSEETHWFSRLISWLESGEAAPMKHQADIDRSVKKKDELADFIKTFASIRFDKQAVNSLCAAPLSWRKLEEDFINSGAKDHSPKTRLAYAEWLFSSSEDCTCWLDTIPERLTFKTRRFPLTFLEGQAIITAYRQKALGGPPITVDAKQNLAKLVKKIDRIIKQDFNDSKQVFIRLNSRSPKDGVMYPGCPGYNQLKRQVEAESKRIHAEVAPLNEKKHRLQAMLASLAVKALALNSGKEAVALLTNSERTFRDLNQAARFPNLWAMTGIIRSFESIPYHGEFRVFVYKGNITAISQYDYRFYFPELNQPGEQDKIREKIKEFFVSEVMELLGQKNYIVDLGILKSGEIKIIELNPYEPSTGTGLFSWEEDLSLLRGLRKSDEPLPVRIVTSKDTHPPILFPEWEAILQDQHT